MNGEKLLTGQWVVGYNTSCAQAGYPVKEQGHKRKTKTVGDAAGLKVGRPLKGCFKEGMEKSMSTTLAKPAEVQRKWYLLDATGKPLGRVAVQAAILLRGKHKPTFTPNVDCGDHVIIINCDKAVLTGNKLDKKYYRHHSGWVGGLKEIKYRKLMSERPEFAMSLAVKRMLPGNTLGANALKRLRAYKGENHNNQAQKPQAFEF